ncbi:multidrug MFS transporter [Bacillus thuringiensis]|uniref:sugar transferase n=1 Tax=Bacillus thuringiensis TaxID=1428 RepID=UPI000BFE3E7A|nr:sugar transferase [Bacillus thuringiensis]PGH73516.1 multidrug MFS transporter [Bacillus thuringiensis]
MNLVKVSENKLKKEANEILVCEQVPVRKGYILAKRCVDFMGALCGLIILSPVFLMVAILIKYEDPKGPVFFKQIRMGKNGRNFYMYKFRSMVTDAEKRLEDLLIQNEVSGAMFKMKDDPRVTQIGKFIRRTSIDELPQLINVLKGEMSLVGPRPPLPREVQEYTNYDRQRLMVKPGCTGIWQISGRSSLSFAEMVELDIEYIINRNLILDFKIIIKTVGVMLFDKNAY